MLMGICPGFTQADAALREAKRGLRAGLPDEEVLRLAKKVGAFAGPIRNNLVGMLDGIGLAQALGIESTGSLFDEPGLHLAGRTSAISYPVFVDGQNYRGTGPSLTRHPAWRSLLVASGGAGVAMAPEALVVPLGQAASEAVELLISKGRVQRDRCLLGVPHPSPANGWRVRQYEERRETLRQAVGQFFAARHPAATEDLVRDGPAQATERPKRPSFDHDRVQARPGGRTTYGGCLGCSQRRTSHRHCCLRVGAEDRPSCRGSPPSCHSRRVCFGLSKGRGGCEDWLGASTEDRCRFLHAPGLDHKRHSCH